MPSRLTEKMEEKENWTIISTTMRVPVYVDCRSKLIDMHVVGKRQGQK